MPLAANSKALSPKPGFPFEDFTVEEIVEYSERIKRPLNGVEALVRRIMAFLIARKTKWTNNPLKQKLREGKRLREIKGEIKEKIRQHVVEQSFHLALNLDTSARRLTEAESRKLKPSKEENDAALARILGSPDDLYAQLDISSRITLRADACIYLHSLVRDARDFVEGLGRTSNGVVGLVDDHERSKRWSVKSIATTSSLTVPNDKPVIEASSHIGDGLISTETDGTAKTTEYSSPNGTEANSTTQYPESGWPQITAEEVIRGSVEQQKVSPNVRYGFLNVDTPVTQIMDHLEGQYLERKQRISEHLVKQVWSLALHPEAVALYFTASRVRGPKSGEDNIDQAVSKVIENLKSIYSPDLVRAVEIRLREAVNNEVLELVRKAKEAKTVELQRRPDGTIHSVWEGQE